MGLIESFFNDSNDPSLERYMCQTLADSIHVIKDQWAGMDVENIIMLHLNGTLLKI